MLKKLLTGLKGRWIDFAATEQNRWVLIVLVGLTLEVSHRYTAIETQRMVADNQRYLRQHIEMAQAFISANAKLEEVRREENALILKRLATLDASISAVNERQVTNILRIRGLEQRRQRN